MTHIDYSWWRPDLNSLRAAGVTAVSRYLAFLPNGKVIQKPEYDALIAAGISVMLNWESSGRSWRDGYGAGLREGAEARRQARALGHPDSRPIVQSMDEGVPAGMLDTAAQYQHGFNDGGGCGPQGAYGTKLVLDHLFDCGLITVGWQTNARGWEGNGPDCARASLLQRTSHSLNGLPADQYDESTIVGTDWGQHPIAIPHPVPVPPKPPAPPKPPPIVTGGSFVDPAKIKERTLTLTHVGYGLFSVKWDAGIPLKNSYVSTLGPAPAPYGPDQWWDWSIEGHVRSQVRGNAVIVTGFFPRWKPGEANPQVNVLAIGT